MNIYRVYGAFLRDVIKVSESIHVLSRVKSKERIQYVQLEEETFVLTKEIEYFEHAVTAHKLSQYRKVFSTVKLKDKSSAWLSSLLWQDIIGKEKLYEINGS